MADDVNPTASEKLDDDEPVRLDADMPPEIASPLAPFGGREPDRPKWFTDALAHEPERSFVPVDGANIELLTWGQVGKPGLIFVHGNSAHADWWSFIAPFLADDWRVAAISFAGMGASDWRETYSFEQYATETYECAKAAGLYDAPQKPIYVGHSFGGSQVFYSANRHPDRMKAAVLIDTGFGGPPTPAQMEEWRQQAIAEGRHEDLKRMNQNMAQRTRPNKVYATLEEALTRFRFMPPQVPGNLFIADYIARKSLMRAPMADGSGEGWTWRFDPFLWGKLDRGGMPTFDAAKAPPIAHIYGDRSQILRRRGGAGSFMRANEPDPFPPSAPRICIPDSEHHIMVDQPLALVSALRALLSVWPA